ncbi:MAG: hypothetical protein Q9227_004982 [Pyrenula ochraceoflavens]
MQIREFLQFLQDFSSFATTLIELDVQRLVALAEDGEKKLSWEPFCRPYLHQLYHILNIEDNVLYLQLQGHFSLEPFYASLIDRLLGDKLLSRISELFDIVVDLLPQKSSLVRTVISILRCTSIFAGLGTKQKIPKTDVAVSTSKISRMNEFVLSICTKANDAIDKAISKQYQWLTVDYSSEIFSVVANMYMSLTQYDEALAQRMVLQLDLQDFGCDMGAAPEIIGLAWKLRVLRQCVTTGRMELRVYGLESIQNEIDRLWRQFSPLLANAASKPPLVRYLVWFIRRHKLIEYLVGADSHPQLTGRSSRLVQFLVSSDAFLDEDLDAMWQAITDSQGARLVTEILQVIASNFLLFSLEQAFRILDKLLVLPVNKFDAGVERFSYDISRWVYGKYKPATGARALELPTKLALRLFRDAQSYNGLSTEDISRLRNAAFYHLKLNIDHGLPPELEERLIRECVADITHGSNTAVSSVRALHVWIQCNPPVWAPRLATEFSLTRPLIDTLLRHLGTRQEVIPTYNDDLWALLCTLGAIILHCPAEVNPDLISVLWNNVLLSKVAGPQANDIAWEWLSQIIRMSVAPNAVFECLAQDYIPYLQPHEFLPMMLVFVQNTVEHDMRISATIPTKEDSPVHVPGIERVWKFVLEAKADDMGQLATSFMIAIYLDNTFVTKRPHPSVEATHAALVDRCIKQILTAATKLKAFSDGTMSGEDEPMVIIASDDELNSVALEFSRSLCLLRQFLQGLRSRAPFSPRPIQERQLLNVPSIYPSLRGTEMRLRYSTNGGRSSVSNAEIVIGCDNTAHELAEYLVSLSGFTKINVLSMGQRLLLHDNAETLGSLKLNQHPIVVWKGLDAEERRGSGSPCLRASSIVEAEVLTHFDQLCGLLELEDRHAKDMYDFLIQFPPPCSFQDLSGAVDVPFKFPTDRPYKFLYLLTILRGELEQDILADPLDEQRILLAVQAIVSTLSHSWAVDGDETVRALISHQVVECLHVALQARLSETVSQSLFPEPPMLTNFLLNLIQGVAKSSDREYFGIPAPALVQKSCAAMIEAALHERRVWEDLQSASGLPDLLQQLLLKDERLEVRKALAETLYGLSGLPRSLTGLKSPPSNPVSSRYPADQVRDFLSWIWSNVLTQLLPTTIAFRTQSSQLFDVAQATLRQIKDQLSGEDVAATAKEWWSLLAKYQHKDVVGHPASDCVIPGFTQLLIEISGVSQGWDGNLDRKGLLQAIFAGPLFPETFVEERSTREVLEPKSPILQSQTRADLYQLVHKLIDGPETLQYVLDLVLEVNVENDNFSSFPGGRLLLRSEQGFAGLRNLSNTCYLNSLFTQLFMNLEFREFVINANIANKKKQTLLSEMGHLFASMQDTWRKWADPSGVVECIETFDGSPIDINIQMDVDEFFNLLFDRLEAQILGTEEKQRFRSLYGGQLVQQMKSRECDHISERLEPFSAIQCEIKGKMDLEESLRTYVEGEIMQGDNKYLCTSCNRHVDAVKRACLKDVPNNVIFHLKRFDFDMTTMTRCKVNDEFRFPDRIDLSPYKVETLNDPDKARLPDVFELVGVLVHQGTAETGHYYSYIRERPTSKLSNDSWVHYNDADVTDFDYRKINECCFGGQDYPFHTPKINNAYMLFYQRVASLESFASRYRHPGGLDPFHLPVPRNIGNKIAMENEQFARDYCVQDASHALFVRQLLEKAMRSPQSCCSESHKLERKALSAIFDYVEGVSSRTRGYPELEESCNQIVEYCARCGRCAERILQLLTKSAASAEKLQWLLLYHGERTFRKVVVEVLLTCLRSINRLRPRTSMKLTREFVATLSSFWPDLHSWYRASSEYFTLLDGVLDLGDVAESQLVDDDWLKRCLELIYIQRPCENLIDNFKPWRSYYRLLQHAQSHYKIAHGHMLVFFSNFLKHFNICRPARDETPNGFVYMNGEEWRLFAPGFHNGSHAQIFMWLNEIIILDWNKNAVDSIIETILERPELTNFVKATLENGLYSHDALYFIKHANTFAKCSLKREAIAQFVKVLFGGFDGLGPPFDSTAYTYWEPAYIDFMAEFLQSNVSSPGVLNQLIRIPLATAKVWAPLLLLSRTLTVRRDTLVMILNLIQAHLQVDEPDTEIHSQTMEAIAGICERSMSFIRERYCQPSSNRTMFARQEEELQSLMQSLKETFSTNEDAGFEISEKAERVIAVLIQVSEVTQELGSDELQYPSDEDESVSYDGEYGESP